MPAPLKPSVAGAQPDARSCDVRLRATVADDTPARCPRPSSRGGDPWPPRPMSTRDAQPAAAAGCPAATLREQPRRSSATGRRASSRGSRRRRRRGAGAGAGRRGSGRAAAPRCRRARRLRSARQPIPTVTSAAVAHAARPRSRGRPGSSRPRCVTSPPPPNVGSRRPLGVRRASANAYAAGDHRLADGERTAVRQQPTSLATEPSPSASARTPSLPQDAVERARRAAAHDAPSPGGRRSSVAAPAASQSPSPVAGDRVGEGGAGADRELRRALAVEARVGRAGRRQTGDGRSGWSLGSADRAGDPGARRSSRRRRRATPRP